MRAARPLDRRLLRGGRVRRRPVARRARGRAAPPGSACACTATSSARARASQLAVELGAASVDHCTYLTDADVDALAGGDTVATFLPATDFSTRQPYPDARRVIDAGATRRDRHELQPRLELHDLDGVLHRARRARHAHDRPRRRCSPRRCGGARALRRTDVGHLAPGARADAVVLDAPSYSHLVYRPGVPLVAATLVGGR